MERGLAQVVSIENVEGAFVCDNAGDVIAASAPAVLATITMNHLGRELGRAFTAMEAAGQAATRLELRYDSWLLLATDVGPALLLVVCRPAVDLPVLRMTVDMVATGWRKDGSAQKRMRRNTNAVRRDLVTRAPMDDVSQRTWRFIDSHA